MSVRGRAGALLIECALVLAILVMLAIGIADASAGFRTKHVLQMAAREGARVASVTPELEVDDPRVVAVVMDILNGAGVEVDRSGSSVTAPGGIAAGNPVMVQVTHDYEPMVLGRLGMTLQASSTMRYE